MDSLLSQGMTKHFLHQRFPILLADRRAAFSVGVDDVQFSVAVIERTEKLLLEAAERYGNGSPVRLQAVNVRAIRKISAVIGFLDDNCHVIAPWRMRWWFRR